MSVNKPLAPAQSLSGLDDKILVTIAYPPTGQASKFKIKGRHTVARVLLSACTAFNLDHEGWVFSKGFDL